MSLNTRIIPAQARRRRRGPGRPDEHHWLRAARTRVGHLFPRLLSHSAYNRRLRDAAWLPDHTPASAELLRLPDGTPVVCGRSLATATRSDLAGWAGYGHDTSHHCFYWGSRLRLITTPEGTVTGFGLANPKLYGEREHARLLLASGAANRSPKGSAWTCIRAISPTSRSLRVLWRLARTAGRHAVQRAPMRLLGEVVYPDGEPPGWIGGLHQGTWLTIGDRGVQRWILARPAG